MSEILTSFRGDLSLEFPLLMGILNVTPDSFSDGGSYNSADGIVSRVDEFLLYGVDIADIGGESTRPGSGGVEELEELNRVLPAVAHCTANGIYVSVDTTKPQVALESLRAGAAMVNDVSGFRNPEMISVCAEFGCAVCIMHMLGEPGTMQDNPVYGNVVEDVKKYLLDAAERCIRAGIKESSICVDPGFGFGKTLEDNYKLLAGLDDIKSAGFPVLAGISRKSMIGSVVNRPPLKRLAGTIAAHTAAVIKGADIIRAHDIQETADMLKVLKMLKKAGG